MALFFLWINDITLFLCFFFFVEHFSHKWKQLKSSIDAHGISNLEHGEIETIYTYIHIFICYIHAIYEYFFNKIQFSHIETIFDLNQNAVSKDFAQ